MLDWLRLARHQAVDSYLPDSDTVRHSCLEDVAACDLYVLILGHRYGFQPAEDNPEGLSITHLEFRRAGECGIPRVALLRTSLPDVRLSDLQDPARAPLVLAFRDEVARQVRPAEFSDLKGLIQGLSTGIQGELDKLAKRDAAAGRSGGGGPGAAAGAAAGVPGRAGGTAGGAGCPAGRGRRCRAAGGGVVRAGRRGQDQRGAGVRAPPAGRGRGGLAVRAPRTRRCWRPGSASWPPSSAPPIAGTRWPSVHAVLAASPAEWLLVFDNAPDRASVARFVPPAGPGRVLITSRNQIWPPGQALEVPVLDPQVAAEFLVSRTGDADRRAALELAGELGGLPLALEQAAAYVQASGEAWPDTWPCSGSGARTCWAAASRPGTPRRWPPPGGWRLRTCSRPRRARPGCCGCWRSARPRRSRCGCCCNPARA